MADPKYANLPGIVSVWRDGGGRKGRRKIQKLPETASSGDLNRRRRAPSGR